MERALLLKLGLLYYTSVAQKIHICWVRQSEIKASAQLTLLQGHLFSGSAAFCDQLTESNLTQSLWFLRKIVLSVWAACSLHLALMKASPCLSDSAAPKDCSIFSHSLGQDETQSVAAQTKLKDSHSPLTASNITQSKIHKTKFHWPLNKPLRNSLSV